ncbi:MAG: hypothetical protein AAGF85_15920 [Bacteroidota bacterium]
MKLGLVTCAEYPQLPKNEEFLLSRLAKSGVQTLPVVWSKKQNWSKFDALVIRSVWDYHKRPEEFTEWLLEIKTQNVAVFNSVDLIIKNMDKRYLLELKNKKIPIVPTEVLQRNTPVEIDRKMSLNHWESVVVKPTISATAFQTHLIRNKAHLQELQLQSDLTYLIQPYIPQIQKGEYSLIFFNGKFSHSVLKKPKPNEFKVQSDFGGSFERIRVADDIIAQARMAIRTLDETPLYARVDGLVINGKFILMELELIEPELFLLTEELERRFIKSIQGLL